MGERKTKGWEEKARVAQDAGEDVGKWEGLPGRRGVSNTERGDRR